MKTKIKLTKKQKEQKKDQAQRIIKMALKHFSGWELIEMIKEESGDDEYKTRDEHISDMESEGYKILKDAEHSVTVRLTNLADQIKFDEFIEKFIPYYEDQQTLILF